MFALGAHINDVWPLEVVTCLRSRNYFAKNGKIFYKSSGNKCKDQLEANVKRLWEA